VSANDEIELKPCPFCGGPAEIRKSRQCVDYEGESMVYEVSICCSEENRCFCHPSTDGFQGETYGRALEGAAKEWNRRVA
jgi:hypothetical protein